MSNFFLHNQACNTSLQDFINGMLEINAVYVDREEDDIMLKHDNIWYLASINTLYNTSDQNAVVICKLINQLQTSLVDIDSEEQFDSLYTNNDLNAFLGIDFQNLSITEGRQICNKEDYIQAKNAHLWTNVNSNNLWKDRTKLFPSLTFCDAVESQLKSLGASPEFKKILVRLSELDKVARKWTLGAFNHKEVVAQSGLNISSESESTLNNNKFRQERIFKLPTGESELFNLHIKIGGGLRICFYPDNEKKKIYVGYIGQHLSTTKFN